MKTQLSLKTSKGFSLVELLVVIAVIAIIAAIAIPNITGITENAKRASALRAAQEAVSTYNNAIAAGYSANNANVGAALTALRTGITIPASGAMAAMTFKFPQPLSQSYTNMTNFIFGPDGASASMVAGDSLTYVANPTTVNIK